MARGRILMADRILAALIEHGPMTRGQLFWVMALGPRYREGAPALLELVRAGLVVTSPGRRENGGYNRDHCGDVYGVQDAQQRKEVQHATADQTPIRRRHNGGASWES